MFFCESRLSLSKIPRLLSKLISRFFIQVEDTLEKKDLLFYRFVGRKNLILNLGETLSCRVGGHRCRRRVITMISRAVVVWRAAGAEAVTPTHIYHIQMERVRPTPRDCTHVAPGAPGVRLANRTYEAWVTSKG